MRTDWLNVSVLSTIFGNPSLLLFQIWYLANWNIQKLVSQHTRGRYTFQPLWVSDITENLSILVCPGKIFQKSDFKLLNLAKEWKQIGPLHHHLTLSVWLQMQFDVIYI